VLISLTIMALIWRFYAPTLLAKRLSQKLGHQVTVESLSLGWGFSLSAMNVRVDGAPPFEKETLAVIDRLSIRLQGAEGWFTPSEVIIDGLNLVYLGTPHRNNLFAPSPPQKKSASLSSARARALPRIHVRSGRVMGHFAFEPRPRIDFRSGSLQLIREPDGAIFAKLGDLITDIQDRVSLRVPQITLTQDAEKIIQVQADFATIQLPRGGDLIRCASLKIDTTKETIAAECFTPSVNGPPTTHLSLSADLAFHTASLSIHIQDLGLNSLAYLGNRSIGLHHAKGSIEGNVTFDGGAGTAAYSLDLKVEGFDLDHPSWDRVPWRGLQAATKIQGTYEFSAHRLVLSDWEATFLGLPLGINGSIEILPLFRGELSISTPPHNPPSCAALLQAQPEVFRQALQGLSLDGFLGFQASIGFDSSAWEKLSFAFEISSLCTVKSEPTALAALYPILTQPGITTGALSPLPLGKFHPDYVPLAKLPRHVIGAFTTSEDSKFYRHNGFDLDMIRAALAQDLESRSTSRGASTITQQLAKNLFLTHHRTIVRKLKEAILTWRLNRLIGKDRTLELYLNIIELGPGIQGIRQASLTYFGKEPSDLLPLESAHLAALTPNPHVLARRFRDGQVDEGWMQRLNDLLGMMKRMGRLSREELAKARNQTLVLRPLVRGVSGRP
jgi:hypothetical protein